MTVRDLTTDEAPSAEFWEQLAEKRREALVEALEENQFLHEKNEALETELNHSRSMLQQSRELVEVLTEMLQEKENEANERAEGEGPASQYSHISEAEEVNEGLLTNDEDEDEYDSDGKKNDTAAEDSNAKNLE